MKHLPQISAAPSQQRCEPYSLVLLDIFKAENYYCCYHSLIYFSKGEKMSKLLKLTFFKVFFLLFLNFNVILISCLTTQGKGGCKRIQTRYILCLYQFLSPKSFKGHMLTFAHSNINNFLSFKASSIKAFFLISTYTLIFLPSLLQEGKGNLRLLAPILQALNNKHLFGVLYLRDKITIELRLELNQMSSCRTSQINQSVDQSIKLFNGKCIVYDLEPRSMLE